MDQICWSCRNIVGIPPENILRETFSVLRNSRELRTKQYSERTFIENGKRLQITMEHSNHKIQKIPCKTISKWLYLLLSNHFPGTNSTSWPPTHEHIFIHRGASTRGLHSSENCQWIHHKTVKVYLTTKAATKDFVYQTCLISSRGFTWHSWR
jgi:hypothetical protein